MARPRKRHVQQDLFTRRNGYRPRGGFREGAGRPPKGRRSSAPHKRRVAIRASEPQHVVAPVVAAVGVLRKRHIYKAIRWATLCAAKRDDFRIVHMSIQSTHLHLIVEAENKTVLAKGMQGFQISAAKLINAAITKRTGTRRRGRVFRDRYFARALKSPRSVRSALSYVLNNWRHHEEDRAVVAKNWRTDPYSTGWQFTGWTERASALVLPTKNLPKTYEPLFVWFPRTCLLREGWRRQGTVSYFDVPGPLHE